MATPKPVVWKGVYYAQMKDMPKTEANKYRAAHPKPNTLATYYEFADAYIRNGFNGTKAWIETHPQASADTGKWMAWLVLTYNEEIKAYVNEAKQKVAENYNLDWCIAKLGQIADDDTVQPKDKIAGIKAIQNQLMKMRELEVKADNKEDIVKVELVGEEDEDTD